MSATLTMRTSLPTSVPQWSAKPRTLVVDDSPTILHAICSLLEHREIVDIVGRTDSGKTTISAVRELKPELVLMDADLPGMSGLRASLLLTQSFPEVKIVLMSMDTTPQFRQACSGCGAYAVIYKPKFLSELSRLLHAEPGAAWGRTGARARRRLKT